MIRTRRAAYTAAALTAFLTIGLVGCGGNGDAADPDPTPTTSTPTTTSPPATQPPTPEEKALAQLEAYLDVRDDALRAMKVDRRRLDKVAGGQEYLTAQQRVLEYASNKFSFRGEYSHTFGEPLDRGAYVLITDCEDESNVEFLTQKGDPVTQSLNGEPLPVARSIDYTLKLIKGRWLVMSSAYAVDDANQVQSC